MKLTSTEELRNMVKQLNEISKQYGESQRMANSLLDSYASRQVASHREFTHGQETHVLSGMSY